VRQLPGVVLAGDLEQCDVSTSSVTLHQSAVNVDLSTNCEATIQSFSSPGGVSGVVRGRQARQRARHFDRYWSPDLSCFRQPRSPDPSDEDYFTHHFRSEKIPADDNVAFPSSRSRLLRRLLFSGRAIEAGKASGGTAVRHSADSGFDSSTKDGPRTVGDGGDEDLLVDVRRYRSLSRRDQTRDSRDVEELERCPPTPPLAVFLSSEDITSTIFPLRHATSEPASSRSRAPFNSSPLSARNSPAADVETSASRRSKRRKERRPLSECFGTTLAVKLTGTLGTLTLTRARPTGNIIFSIACTSSCVISFYATKVICK